MRLGTFGIKQVPSKKFWGTGARSAPLPSSCNAEFNCGECTYLFMHEVIDIDCLFQNNQQKCWMFEEVI